MPTHKQKLVASKIVENRGKSVSKAMRVESHFQYPLEAY